MFVRATNDINRLSNKILREVSINQCERPLDYKNIREENRQRSLLDKLKLFQTVTAMQDPRKYIQHFEHTCFN